MQISRKLALNLNNSLILGSSIIYFSMPWFCYIKDWISSQMQEKTWNINIFDLQKELFLPDIGTE